MEELLRQVESQLLGETPQRVGVVAIDLDGDLRAHARRVAQDDAVDGDGFETVVDNVLTAVFLHSGQVCSAGARLIVEESLHDRFVDEVVWRAERIALGGPFDPNAETGALISAAHRDKVEAYVAAGLAEGAVLRCGGRRPDDEHLRDGFFYRPTVLDRCHSGMSVTKEESFGPVLTVETFTDEDDAVRLANDTDYGLSASVWSTSLETSLKTIRRIRADDERAVLARPRFVGRHWIARQVRDARAVRRPHRRRLARAGAQEAARLIFKSEDGQWKVDETRREDLRANGTPVSGTPGP
mgnify:CR=1 FL=1